MEYRELTEQEYKDRESRILYEDNHLLIVNKRPGDIVQGDKTGDECLTDIYKALIAKRDGKPGKVFMGVPHRLDRPVSGICILAKTSKSLERMSAMFRNGDIHKKYWALCCAKPDPEEGTLENWLIRNEKQNKTYIVPQGSHKEAKFARLNYKFLRSTERYHLVEVELLTGRHHQIRCQLAGIGCVIKGDLKYGARRSNPDGSSSLHAHEVTFIHPVQKVPVHIIADFVSAESILQG